MGVGRGPGGPPHFTLVTCYNPTRMKNSGRTNLLWLALLLAPGAFAQQQFAALGDFKLESGVLQECRIGYRTFGSLNSDQSNVILFPNLGWWNHRTVERQRRP